MKKKLIIVIMVAVALILLFPIPLRYKDGGTVKYQAVLYSVTNYKSLRGVDGYDTGVEIKILGITVYENTTFDSNKVTVKNGRYVMEHEDTEDIAVPSIKVSDNQIIFTFDLLSSYLNLGSYSIDNDILTMTTHDNVPNAEKLDRASEKIEKIEIDVDNIKRVVISHSKEINELMKRK